MLKPLLALHIAAGTVALLSMWVPMFARKGARLHRTAGTIFVAAMATVSASALVLAGARFLFDPRPAARRAGLFLLFVGILTGSSVSTGVRVLRAKHRTGPHLNPWDVGISGLLTVASVWAGIYGLTTGRVLFTGFAVIGLLTGGAQLTYWLRRPAHPMHWWFEHMSSMLGASIAATTAFVVVNAERWGMETFSAIVWLAPTIVGAPVIAIWTTYYRRKFSIARKESVMTRKNQLVREVVIVAALALVIFSPGAIPLLAQAPQQGFPGLIDALKNTPGCLGVEAARTASGKQVLFAWFENKKAVLNWFYSDTHQALMRTFAPGASSGRRPLSDIADDSGPILAIASLTYADTSQVDGVQLPVSQIAIELYAPLPGGLAAGGRFAPGAVKVPGLLEAPTGAR